MHLYISHVIWHHCHNFQLGQFRICALWISFSALPSGRRYFARRVHTTGIEKSRGSRLGHASLCFIIDSWTLFSKTRISRVYVLFHQKFIALTWLNRIFCVIITRIYRREIFWLRNNGEQAIYDNCKPPRSTENRWYQAYQYLLLLLFIRRVYDECSCQWYICHTFAYACMHVVHTSEWLIRSSTRNYDVSSFPVWRDASFHVGPITVSCKCTRISM